MTTPSRPGTRRGRSAPLRRPSSVLAGPRFGGRRPGGAGAGREVVPGAEWRLWVHPWRAGAGGRREAGGGERRGGGAGSAAASMCRGAQ